MPLEAAPAAHRYVDERRKAGSVVLTPWAPEERGHPWRAVTAARR